MSRFPLTSGDDALKQLQVRWLYSAIGANSNLVAAAALEKPSGKFRSDVDLFIVLLLGDDVDVGARDENLKHDLRELMNGAG